MPKIKKEDFFKNQPYKSILHMLMTFQKQGLKPKHFRYELGKDTKDSNGNICRAELIVFYQDGKITATAKTIEHDLGEKRHLYNDKIEKGCIRYPKQLREKLSILEFAEIIFNDGGYYKICKDFFNTGWKIAGIDTFNLYPNEQTLIEGCDNIKTKKIIIQGLNLEFLHIKDGDEKFKKIKDSIKKINDAVQELQNIKEDRIKDMWSFKVKEFCSKTKSKRIKQALKGNIWAFFSFTQMYIFDCTEKEIINVFEVENKMIYECANTKKGREILKPFSKKVFSKEYNFSFNDWKEIIDLRYEVAKWLIHYMPFSITALCFADFSDNPIITMQQHAKQIKEKQES
ncbi:MAG: hypothetical protein MUO82_03670 [Candidatus Thermoplasmatota archaeon]|nr:hypothetical protein [Candidatus Thermoplasmatota archaeon]